MIFWLRSALNGTSQVFLQAHPGSGLLILIAVGLHEPRLLVGALLGLLGGSATARCSGYARRDIELGLYGYNALLLGMLIVLTLGLSPLAMGLALIGGVATAPLQQLLLRQMREHGGLPGFTLPFILLGWVTLALASTPEPLSSLREPATLHLDGPGALSGLLSGVGQVMFMADPRAGLCLFGALLLADRRAALWMLCGSAVGIYAALMGGASDSQALGGIAGFNPALAALALSLVHRSDVFPALGIALALIAWQAFERYGLTPLTMPFILACWTVTGCNRLYRLLPCPRLA